MLKSEAERRAVVDWMRLPAKDRATEQQAAIFAMQAARDLSFKCSGDRYQHVKGWLLSRVGLPG